MPNRDTVRGGIAVTATLTNGRGGAGEDALPPAQRAVRLALGVLLVGAVCALSTEIGFAHKIPPHNISALWPTGAILFSVLVVTPVRHWWAYVVAAYFTSIINDARAGFPVAAMLFVAAGLLEILIAAVGVRRFAGGLRAFDTLRGLVAYVVIAVVLAPFLSAFVAAFAGGTPGYWFYWRVWFLSEGLAYLMLAPAILSWIAVARAARGNVPLARLLEAVFLACGLLAISLLVFRGFSAGEGRVPVLVYLPLPFLLWAAVRFGPTGVNTALVAVALVSISGAVHGRGPFVTGSPAENVLALQLFLLAISLPLMFLAALIAERRLRTSALRESEARFRSLADTTPVLIWMSGEDKLCTFLNKTWLDFTGRTPEQDLGNGWLESVHPDDHERCFATYADAFDAQREFTVEYRLRRHDGEYRWVSDKGVPRRAPDGTFLGYIGCADDVTARKEAELAAQRHRAELAHVARLSTMGELSASLAHELNQPLAAILSNAQTAQHLLASQPADLDEVREILDDVVADDKRASAVIRRLRALVRKEPPALAPLDLTSVIGDVVQLVHSDAVLRNSRVSVEVDPALPPVQGDRIELQQVALNLLVNAFDAMRDCPAHQRQVAVRAALDRADTVKVIVRDYGAGLGGGDLERVFQPFYTTKRDGLGMGLSISRTIIEAHGGRLWAENNPGRGATFCFTVPVWESKGKP
jgi:PAS domain S-box-containing protein